MRGRVLIIEDTAELAELYALYLEREGLECSIAPDAETALPISSSSVWDLVILDLNLPGMDGFQFLERFRTTSQTPVMILSAREADEDVILGLGTGADDFVTKPCPPRVLAARARAHLRRSAESRMEDPPVSAGRYRFGPFDFDTEAMYLRKGRLPVSLSSRELGILSLLVSQSGRPLSPQEIYDSVWGKEFGEVGAVGVYIQRLRRKLEEDPSTPYYIQTVHGLGYRFNPESLVHGGSPT